jgi:hypothetical protein
MRVGIATDHGGFGLKKDLALQAQSSMRLLISAFGLL